IELGSQTARRERSSAPMSKPGNTREAILDLRARWRGAPEVLDRRLQKYFLACCRRIWRLLPEEDSRRGIELTEQYLDGRVDEQEFAHARYCAEAAAFHFDYAHEPEDLEKVAQSSREAEAIPRSELEAM